MFYCHSIAVADAPKLQDLIGPGALCWIHNGCGILGFGQTAAHQSHGEERFAHAELWWREVVANTQSQLTNYGSY